MRNLDYGAGDVVDRFEIERMRGFREGALAVYNAMKDRPDVATEIQDFALELVRRSANVSVDCLLQSLGVSNHLANRTEALSPGGPSSSDQPR